MLIEKMTERTAPFVAKLEAECFSCPWDEKTLIKSLSNNSVTYLVAKEDDIAVGYVCYYDLIDEFSIINIAVDSTHRGKGIAIALLQRVTSNAIDLARGKITLEVRASNTAAINLYKKCGYIKTGEKEDYYSKPKETAYFYQLEIERTC